MKIFELAWVLVHFFFEGSVEGLAAIESIMEHVSHETKIDALELRRRNLTNETPIGNYFDDISSWAGVDARKQDIAAFNKVRLVLSVGVA